MKNSDCNFLIFLILFLSFSLLTSIPIKIADINYSVYDYEIENSITYFVVHNGSKLYDISDPYNSLLLGSYTNDEYEIESNYFDLHSNIAYVINKLYDKVI